MGLPAMKRVNPGEPQSSYLTHKLWGSHREVGGSGSRIPDAAAAASLAQVSSGTIYQLGFGGCA